MRRYVKERRMVAEAAKVLRLELRESYPDAKPSAIRKGAEMVAKQAYRNLKHGRLGAGE